MPPIESPPNRTAAAAASHLATRRRHRLRGLLGVGLSLAIVGYLVWQVRNEQAFADLWEKPKNWSMFALAAALCLFSLLVSLVRWYYLVRALELPFTLHDALRLGFLGNLLNFVSLGNVGGDLFKMVFIAREHPQHRPEAVATVVVDRLIGLYGLLIVASTAILAGRLWQVKIPELVLVVKMTLAGTVLGGIALAAILVPGFTQGALSEALAELPKVGRILGKLIGAVRMYRRRMRVLMVAIVVSMGIHSCVVLGFVAAGRALPGHTPAPGEQFVIVPLSMVVGAIPIFPLGLGAFEGALEYLYQHLSAAGNVAPGQGLLVAFEYRLISLAIAVLGIGFWIRNRRAVQEAAAELEG